MVIILTVINYISNIAVPTSILLIILYGLIEKKLVFDIFIDGAKEGLKIVLNIFPTLLRIIFVY